MGVYDDVKTAIEGFITPDLGEIKIRLGVVEARLDAVDNKLGAVEAKIDGVDHKIDSVDQRSKRRDQELTRVMERGFDRIEAHLDGLSRQLRTEEALRSVIERLAAVESKLKICDTEEATH